MTRGARVLVVLVGGALVGCGGGSEGVGGEITSVINQQASIDGEPAGGGDPIPVGGVLVTDDSGVAVFVVAGDPATCELRPASVVVVLPSQGLLLRVMSGTAVCDRSETDSSATFAAPGSLIEVGDSTVVIAAGEESSTVGNVRGEVAVAPAEAGATVAPQQTYVPLEDNERTQVVEGQAPEPPSPYQPSPSVGEAVLRINPDTDTTGTESTTSGSTSTTTSAATIAPPGTSSSTTS